MLTTSRREIFAEETEINEAQNTASIDAKAFGKQAYTTGAEIRRSAEKGSQFSDSYFAMDDKVMAAKLFGESIDDEVWNEYTKADAENFTNPDLMPSSTTMQNHSEIKVPYFDTKTSVKPTYDAKLSSKGKVAIVSYIAIVLALVLIISLTAIAVNATMMNVSDLQIEIKETIAQIDEMYSDVEANSEEYAAQLGLVGSADASTNYFNTVSTREAVEYEISDNWFNKLCEWVSNVFGG